MSLMLAELRDKGTGYVLASHQQNLLSQDCDDNWYLRQGQLVAE